MAKDLSGQCQSGIAASLFFHGEPGVREADLLPFRSQDFVFLCRVLSLANQQVSTLCKAQNARITLPCIQGRRAV
jgi:hypothetical protein